MAEEITKQLLKRVERDLTSKYGVPVIYHDGCRTVLGGGAVTISASYPNGQGSYITYIDKVTNKQCRYVLLGRMQNITHYLVTLLHEFGHVDLDLTQSKPDSQIKEEELAWEFAFSYLSELGITLDFDTRFWISQKLQSYYEAVLSFVNTEFVIRYKLPLDVGTDELPIRDHARCKVEAVTVHKIGSTQIPFWKLSREAWKKDVRRTRYHNRYTQ